MDWQRTDNSMANGNIAQCPVAADDAAAIPVSSSIDVAEFIDRTPMGVFQITITVLCGLAALLDGFDLLAIGVAAPTMASSLHIAQSELGALFSAALLGLMLGACGLGPLADRIGRRGVLSGSIALFGAFTLCTAFAATLPQLLLFRAFAGIGLGGAMPSFISLAAEYTPRSRRRHVVALLWTGFPLGGVLVGLLAPHVIAAHGWRALFMIGGALPLGLSVILLYALPESVAFLVARNAPWQDVRDLLLRISPSAEIGADNHVVTRHTASLDARVWTLFQRGRGYTTVLLWASYFTTFLMLVTSTAWTPVLLERAGIDRSDAAMGVALFASGSVIGTPLAGVLLARFGARRVLPTVLLCGALAIGATGQAGASPALVLACLTCAGFCLGAASSGLIALAPLLYPTDIRSTAIGWATGWGRFGSFVGPLVIGMLVARGWHIDDMFAALGMPALWGALFTRLLRSEYAADQSDGAAVRR
jgi:AAHS family 4-hydroxybenzoate transporter-like MFS transporter